MKLGWGQSKDRLILNLEECDMARAVVHAGISLAELDEQTHSFTATLDHLRFRSLLEVVKSVLEANGYVSNLENLLAAIDTLRLGILAREGSDDSSFIYVRSFSDCVSFRLPKKNTRGELLQSFYKEIEAYEHALKNIQISTQQQDQKSKASKSIKELSEQVKVLREENAHLKQVNRHLSKEMNSLQKSHRQVERTMDANNVLPDELRIAHVTGVDLYAREASFKLVRKSVRVPIAQLSSVPSEGQRAIVQIESGRVQAVLLFEHPNGVGKIRYMTGEVLFVAKEQFKLRDAERATHVIKARNDFEREIVQKLKRGDKLILHKHSGQIVRFKRLDQVDIGCILEDRMRDQVTTEQLRQNPEQIDDDNAVENAG